MPIITFTLTSNIQIDDGELCRSIGNMMTDFCEADGSPAFKAGALRVICMRTDGSYIALNDGNSALIDLTLRFFSGRSDQFVQRLTDDFTNLIKQALTADPTRSHIVLTLHIEEETRELPGPISLRHRSRTELVRDV